MSSKTIVVALFVVALVGCTKKEEATEATPSAVPSVVAEAPAVAPSANPVVEDDPEIVMAEDLEGKAIQEISTSNLEAQLDELEKEIDKSE